MRAEDLMIGDWVCYKGINNKIAIADFGIDDAHTTWRSEIEPIPLTQKILKDSGFGYIEEDNEITHFYLGDPNYCENMNLHIGNRGKFFWLNTYSDCIHGIKFVHELQHALKISNINKDIIIKS